jgi:hypothetical protein
MSIAVSSGQACRILQASAGQQHEHGDRRGRGAEQGCGAERQHEQQQGRPQQRGDDGVGLPGEHDQHRQVPLRSRDRGGQGQRHRALGRLPRPAGEHHGGGRDGQQHRARPADPAADEGGDEAAERAESRQEQQRRDGVQQQLRRGALTQQRRGAEGVHAVADPVDEGSRAGPQHEHAEEQQRPGGRALSQCGTAQHRGAEERAEGAARTPVRGAQPGDRVPAHVQQHQRPGADRAQPTGGGGHGAEDAGRPGEIRRRRGRGRGLPARRLRGELRAPQPSQEHRAQHDGDCPRHDETRRPRRTRHRREPADDDLRRAGPVTAAGLAEPSPGEQRHQGRARRGESEEEDGEPPPGPAQQLPGAPSTAPQHPEAEPGEDELRRRVGPRLSGREQRRGHERGGQHGRAERQQQSSREGAPQHDAPGQGARGQGRGEERREQGGPPHPAEADERRGDGEGEGRDRGHGHFPPQQGQHVGAGQQPTRPDQGRQAQHEGRHPQEIEEVEKVRAGAGAGPLGPHLADGREGGAHHGSSSASR